jgi:hypothetical protein
MVDRRRGQYVSRCFEALESRGDVSAVDFGLGAGLAAAAPEESQRQRRGQ